MNRREFLYGVVATGLAPMMPFRAITTVAEATSAPTAAAGKILPYMYDFAVQHARSAGEVSPGSVSDFLCVPPEMARAITSRLVDKGVVGVPNALGVSRAINPFRPSSAAINGSVNGVLNTNPYRKVIDVIDDAIEKVGEQIEESIEKLENASEAEGPQELNPSGVTEPQADDRSEEPLDEEVNQSDLGQHSSDEALA